MNAARMLRRTSLLLASALSATASLTITACSDTADSSSAQEQGAKDASTPEAGRKAEASEDSKQARKDAVEMAPEKEQPEKAQPEAQTEERKPESGAKDPFCRALPVVHSSCGACHGATLSAGAPMPLVTFEDFMKPAFSDPKRKVYELVKERVHDTKKPMPPSGTLNSERLDVLDSWLNEGAAKASEAKDSASVAPKCEAPIPRKAPDAEWPSDCEDVYTILAHDPDDASKPFMIPANSEVHPYMTFDAPWGEEEVQLLATRPITDKDAAVHHWILWDNRERVNLTFWAPGATGDSIPKDVGLYMPKGIGALGLDMHYYNRNNDKPLPDRSGLELCTTRKHKRPKTAALSGLFGNANVPAMQRVVNATSCTVKGEMHLIGINPHMHRMGVHAHLELQRGSDPAKVLYDGAFSFEEQTIKPLEDTLIKEGDVLTTVCTFENDTDRTVAFGEGTDDEMCINWIRYYPKGGFTCARMNASGATEPNPDVNPHTAPMPDDSDAGVADASVADASVAKDPASN